MQALLRVANPFFECFLNQLLESSEVTRWLGLLRDNQFMQLYKRLVGACFNLKYADEKEATRMLLETQLKYFLQFKMQGKYFLLSLAMSVNLQPSENPEVACQVRRARLLCLASLPLMFAEDEELREHIEMTISERKDLDQLVNPGNPEFFRLIKQTIAAEESFARQNNFEKYFSLNGFLRNLMNEIIKLHASSEVPCPSLVLKLLDTLTYLMS